MAAKPASRKRKLDGDDVDDTGRKRGRPRVDKQDDSAADRRRTQIRLAQRAYRERKESTITTLQDQVVTLQGSVKKIQSALKQFNNLASQRGLQDLDSRLAGKLSETINLVSLLAQADSTEASTSYESSTSNPRNRSRDDTAMHDSASDPNSPVEAVIPFPNGVSTAWGYSMVDTTQTKTARSYSSDSGFESGSHTSNNSSEWGEVSSPSENVTPQLSETFDENSKSTDLVLSNPTLSLPSNRNLFPAVQLNPASNVPYSFSFPEGSFSQRLHHLSLRRGLELLMIAETDIEVVKRKFWLPLQYATIEELRERIITRLSRPRTAALQSANHYPFIGWGGAGTHYSHLTLQGPRPATRFSFSSGRAVDIPAECDLAGFGGEWFDPGDVEGYLMQKGINIQYNALYADGEVKEPLPFGDGVPDWSEGADTSSAALDRGLLESLDNTPLLTDFNEADVLSDAANGAPLAQTQSWDMSSPDIFDTLAQPGADTDVASLFFDPRRRTFETKKHVTVDVQRLMNKLLEQAVCLGREPGFRRHHVDQALQDAIISVF